jgi:hypothetical protein
VSTLSSFNYNKSVNYPQELQIEVHPEVIGLKGGSKQFFLRIHRGEIERYYEDNGEQATLKRYNLRQSTLQTFFERRNIDLKINKMTQWDREVLRLAMTGDAELRGRVNKLESWKKEIMPAIELLQKLIEALGDKIQLTTKSETDDDPLKLTDFKKIERKRGDNAKLGRGSHNI